MLYLIQPPTEVTVTCEVASRYCCESNATISSIPVGRDDHYWGECMSYSIAESICQIIGLSMCNNPSINDCGGD